MEIYVNIHMTDLLLDILLLPATTIRRIMQIPATHFNEVNVFAAMHVDTAINMHRGVQAMQEILATQAIPETIETAMQDLEMCCLKNL